MPALRGVNIGGWLVLEKWMTPSLFAGTDAKDEYTFMQTPGAIQKIERWRREFITEADFKWLAEHHINAVRIPVGYWVLEADAPFVAAAEQLDWAFTMADAYGLQVLLDVHGLPGSQNGNDHSGRIGNANWQHHRDYRRRSLAVLRTFAERYGQKPQLWGIEIINEPNAGAFQAALRSYYRQAYRLLSRALPARVRIVYSDAWSPRIFAFALPLRRRAVMDVHLYHMATLGAKTHSIEWYNRKLRRRARLLGWLSRFHPIIIGEWSGVVSGESIGTLPPTQQAAIEHAHVALQRELYDRYAGWFYWSYKTESPGTWNYRSLIENGVVVAE